MLRLHTLGVVAGTAALVLTAACQGSDSSADESAADGDTHSVSGVLGGTVDYVPDDPQRVVSLWTTSTQLLDLGIEPVGILDGDIIEERVTPDQWETLKDKPTVGTFDDVDIEKVAALKPDLVVGLTHGFMTEKDIEPFKELGIPTLIWEVAEPPDVWANYPEFADALGKSTDFDKRDAALHDELDALNDEVGEQFADTEWASVRGSGGDTTQFIVDTDQSLAYERIHDAGADFPGFVKNLGEDARYALELSYERMPDLSDAFAIFYEAGPDGKPGEATKPLVDQDVWKQLPAVKAGNAYPLSQTFNYTFAGQEQMVADIRSAFEQASSNGVGTSK